MSENINFISATELPIAEGAEVDVLCVDNGELKRKSASNLGGGGSVEPDMVLTITDFEVGNLSITADNLTITSGGIEDLCNKIREDKKPIVKVCYGINSNDYIYISSEYNTNPYIYAEWVFIPYIAFSSFGDALMCTLLLNLDGSFHEFRWGTFVVD